jgi:hypothetical protein
MLQNAYLDVKIGFDTEENEPPKVFTFFNFHPPQGFNFHRATPPSRPVGIKPSPSWADARGTRHESFLEVNIQLRGRMRKDLHRKQTLPQSWMFTSRLEIEFSQNISIFKTVCRSARSEKKKRHLGSFSNSIFVIVFIRKRCVASRSAVGASASSRLLPGIVS